MKVANSAAATTRQPQPAATQMIHFLFEGGAPGVEPGPEPWCWGRRWWVLGLLVARRRRRIGGRLLGIRAGLAAIGWRRVDAHGRTSTAGGNFCWTATILAQPVPARKGRVRRQRGRQPSLPGKGRPSVLDAGATAAGSAVGNQSDRIVVAEVAGRTIGIAAAVRASAGQLATFGRREECRLVGIDGAETAES